MADKSIEEKVKDIIVEQLGVNPEQVTPQASFIEDLGADSLDIVELVMAFEEEFWWKCPMKTPRNCRPSATSSNTSRNGRSRRSSRIPRLTERVILAPTARSLMEARGKPQDRSSTKFNSAESAPHFGAFPSSIAVCNPPLRQPERRMLSGCGTSRVSGGRTNNLV